MNRVVGKFERSGVTVRLVGSICCCRPKLCWRSGVSAFS